MNQASYHFHIFGPKLLMANQNVYVHNTKNEMTQSYIIRKFHFQKTKKIMSTVWTALQSLMLLFIVPSEFAELTKRRS